MQLNTQNWFCQNHTFLKSSKICRNIHTPTASITIYHYRLSDQGQSLSIMIYIQTHGNFDENIKIRKNMKALDQNSLMLKEDSVENLWCTVLF